MSAATKGSQFHLQKLVNRFPGVLDTAIDKGSIVWVSPLAPDYVEYHDGEFLDELGIKLTKTALSGFWPSSGPRWDALGKTEDGTIILVEAKSHIAEMFSYCKATDSASLSKIKIAFDNTQKAFKSKPGLDWTKPFYQYANRLTHAYLLQELNGVKTCLVFLHFVGDSEMGGPNTKEEWEAAIVVLHEALGITGRVPKYVRDVFVDVSEASKGIYKPIL